jgi:hypothetical protein
LTIVVALTSAFFLVLTVSVLTSSPTDSAIIPMAPDRRLALHIIESPDWAMDGIGFAHRMTGSDIPPIGK